jgi:hypothetical protein
VAGAIDLLDIGQREAVGVLDVGRIRESLPAAASL